MGVSPDEYVARIANGRIVLHMMQQTQGGGKQVMQFGRSRAKLQTDSHQKVTFADVAGCDEAKEELQEIVDFLGTEEVRNGRQDSKGVLLSDGTGKTCLAKAAGEAGVPSCPSAL